MSLHRSRPWAGPSLVRRLSTTALALVAVLGIGLGLVSRESADAETPPAISAPGVSYAGPLTITRGGTYRGAWQSTDPRTPAVLVATTEPVTIVDSAVKGPGTLIQIAVGTAAQVTVQGTYGEGTSGAAGSARFLVADTGWTSLVVRGNDLVSTAGLWLHQASPTQLTIEANRVRNVIGQGPVQFVQMDKVQSGAIDIGWNEVVNQPGASKVEDVISLYKSSGATAQTPIRVHDNFIWGAFPDPLDGSYSGGGIMVGDQGSLNGNVLVEDNQVLGTTNYGISVVCGTNQTVRGNTIISSGRTPDGAWLPATNVGLSMGSEAAWGAGCTTYVSNSATGNDLGWQKQSGRNDFWVPNCADCSGNVARAGAVTYESEKAEWTRWRAKSADRPIGRAPAAVVAPVAPAPTTTLAPPSATPPPVAGGTDAPGAGDGTDAQAELDRLLDELQAVIDSHR